MASQTYQKEEGETRTHDNVQVPAREEADREEKSSGNEGECESGAGKENVTEQTYQENKGDAHYDPEGDQGRQTGRSESHRSDPGLGAVRSEEHYLTDQEGREETTLKDEHPSAQEQTKSRTDQYDTDKDPYPYGGDRTDGMRVYLDLRRINQGEDDTKADLEEVQEQQTQVPAPPEQSNHSDEETRPTSEDNAGGRVFEEEANTKSSNEDKGDKEDKGDAKKSEGFTKYLNKRRITINAGDNPTKNVEGRFVPTGRRPIKKCLISIMMKGEREQSMALERNIGDAPVIHSTKEGQPFARLTDAAQEKINRYWMGNHPTNGTSAKATLFENCCDGDELAKTSNAEVWDKLQEAMKKAKMEPLAQGNTTGKKNEITLAEKTRGR